MQLAIQFEFDVIILVRFDRFEDVLSFTVLKVFRDIMTSYEAMSVHNVKAWNPCVSLCFIDSSDCVHVTGAKLSTEESKSCIRLWLASF